MFEKSTSPFWKELTLLTLGNFSALTTPPKSFNMLSVKGDLSASEIREYLELKDRTHVRERYINPALEAKLIEYTIPDKPNSRLQKYRLTALGKKVCADLEKKIWVTQWASRIASGRNVSSGKENESIAGYKYRHSSWSQHCRKQRYWIAILTPMKRVSES